MNGNGDVCYVLVVIYGIVVVKKMFLLYVSFLDFEVKGYIVFLEIIWVLRNYMLFVVNGCYIKNFLFVKVVYEGYYMFLLIGCYLIIFIEIMMDLILVDVNVYLLKFEVCFSKEIEFYDLICDGIKDVFK